MFNYRNLESNVECVTFSGLVFGRMPEEWCAILPQGISASEISECEGIRESIAEKAECRADHETEVREDGRC